MAIRRTAAVRIRRAALVLIPLVLATLTAAIAATATAAANLTPLRVNWALPESSPVIFWEGLPDAMGFYRSNGIELKHIASPAGASLARGNQSDVSGTDVASLLNDQAQNKDGALVAIFNIAPSAAFRYFVVPSSPIKSLCDLKGKTVGTYSAAAAGLPLFREALRGCGIDPQNDLKLVVIPPGPGIQAALKAGSVDAFVGNVGLQVQTEQELGQKLRNLLLPPALRIATGGIEVARRADISANPKPYIAYARAQIEAVTLAQANPCGAATAMVNKFPELQAPGVSRSDAIASVQAQLAATFSQFAIPKPLKATKAVPRKYGYFWQAQLEPFASDDVTAGLGQFKGGTAKMFTNRIVAAAYKGLNLSKFVKLAKAVKCG